MTPRAVPNTPLRSTMSSYESAAIRSACIWRRSAGPAPARDKIFALFASLEIEDRVAGMVVRPRAATLLDTMAEHLVVAPRHAGARTRFGEVWKAPYPGAENSTRAGEHSYILGCAAGLAEIHLFDTGSAPESQLLGWLNEINVTWHAG